MVSSSGLGGKDSPNGLRDIWDPSGGQLLVNIERVKLPFELSLQKLARKVQFPAEMRPVGVCNTEDSAMVRAKDPNHPRFAYSLGEAIPTDTLGKLAGGRILRIWTGGSVEDEIGGDLDHKYPSHGALFCKPAWKFSIDCPCTPLGWPAVRGET